MSLSEALNLPAAASLSCACGGARAYFELKARPDLVRRRDLRRHVSRQGEEFQQEERNVLELKEATAASEGWLLRADPRACNLLWFCVAFMDCDERLSAGTVDK